MHTETKHAFQAGAIAPFAIVPAGVPVAIWSSFVSSRTARTGLGELIVNDIAALPVLFIFGLPIAWLVTFLVGVPAAIVARRSGHASLATALLVGSAIGVILGLVVAGGSLGSTVVFYVWFSVSTAAAFWAALVRLQRRHDAHAA